MLHLIHPALVHFSVALLVLGGVWEAVALLRARDDAARFGGRLVLLGTLSLLPTLVTGYLAANSVDLTPESAPLLAAHENNGLFLLGVFVACLFWKGWYRGEIPAGQRRLYALLVLVGVALAVYGALLGG